MSKVVTSRVKGARQQLKTMANDGGIPDNLKSRKLRKVTPKYGSIEEICVNVLD